MTEKLLTDVEYNYKYIDERIAEAAEKSGRKREDITFLAATKMVEPEVINHAISLGLDHIGENKVQELLSKYDKYNLDNCSLQFIGHLQTNKVRQIIDKVDLIQSVDSIKLAGEISKQALKINRKCDVLVEVNIGREENKSGVMPEQLEELLCQIAELDGVSVKGLMAIPPICESSQKISEFFNKMHNIFIDISQKKLDNLCKDLLGSNQGITQYVNEMEQKVHIINYTDNLMFRAFGKVENPDYKMYEEFLESRCFPANRDKVKLILKDLDLPFYDPGKWHGHQ